jgi:hypothetical protein
MRGLAGSAEDSLMIARGDDAALSGNVLAGAMRGGRFRDVLGSCCEGNCQAKRM